MINTEFVLKEAKVYYVVFSKPVYLKCPFCKKTQKRIRTYRSLKSLSWHVVHFHRNETGCAFTLEQVQYLLKEIALAIHWGILP